MLSICTRAMHQRKPRIVVLRACKPLRVERSDIVDHAVSIGRASKHVKEGAHLLRVCMIASGRSVQPYLLPSHNRSAAQRGAVHGDGLAGGELDAVVIMLPVQAAHAGLSSRVTAPLPGHHQAVIAGLCAVIASGVRYAAAMFGFGA